MLILSTATKRRRRSISLVGRITRRLQVFLTLRRLEELTFGRRIPRCKKMDLTAVFSPASSSSRFLEAWTRSTFRKRISCTCAGGWYGKLATPLFERNTRCRCALVLYLYILLNSTREGETAHAQHCWREMHKY